MKILLDESTPQKLRLLIDSRHSVVTTWFHGWSGLKNGALLAAAESAGFELFITADQELGYQRSCALRNRPGSLSRSGLRRLFERLPVRWNWNLGGPTP